MKLLLVSFLFLFAACDVPVLNAESAGSGNSGLGNGQPVVENCELKISNTDICVDVASSASPKYDSYWWFEFRLWRTNSGAKEFLKIEDIVVSGKEFAVDPYMTSMGHGSRDGNIEVFVATDSDLFSDGIVYRAIGLDFIMRGAWDIRILLGVKEDTGSGWYEWKNFDSASFAITVQ